jgi:hypothetical protein
VKGRLLVLALVLTASGCLGGASSHRPEDLEAGLSLKAAGEIGAAWNGIDGKRLFDHHVHMIGTGAGGTGNFVNPRMLSWFHPFRHLEYEVLLSAAGVKDKNKADAEYVERLVSLIRGIKDHGKYGLLALDKNYREDGSPDLSQTAIYVSNEYVFSMSEHYPDLFEPIMSVHPYRKDALVEMETYSKRGGRFIKWLPNAMGIDPASPLCVPFYKKMKELHLILLSHAGAEAAVEASGPDLGNPLRLRAALDEGVRVIVAHCASLGDDEDLDQKDEKRRVPSFDLFLRMMDEKKYEGLLFGEISAMTLANRAGTGALEAILRRTDLHARLVNGSDYPLPAANVLIRTNKLENLGFITGEQRAVLNEIYDYNPLLFDFMVKRLVHAPGTDIRFAPSVFMDNPGLQK